MLSLLLSSIAAGLIATLVMLAILYLPLLWNGPVFDVLGAIGSYLTGTLDARARFLGALVYFALGLVFALLYGWLALTFMQLGDGSLPRFSAFAGAPVRIELIYPLLGVAVGLGHGVVAALLLGVLLEHHPLERFRSSYALVASFLLGHVVFGAVVMFFQHQLLQLLPGTGAA